MHGVDVECECNTIETRDKPRWKKGCEIYFRIVPMFMLSLCEIISENKGEKIREIVFEKKEKKYGDLPSVHKLFKCPAHLPYVSHPVHPRPALPMYLGPT